jgi:ATP phosphoribosyltransferase
MHRSEYRNPLVWALPNGSLMMKDRGDMESFVDDMGIGIVGYTQPKPRSEPTCDLGWLRVYTNRPQNMGPLMGMGVYDMCISGRDWMQENKSSVVPVLDLNTGIVNVAVGVPVDPKYDRLRKLGSIMKRAEGSGKKIIVCTEYPSSASEILTKDPVYRQLWGELVPTVMVHGSRHSMVPGKHNEDPRKLNPNVEILMTHGGTEDTARDILGSSMRKSYEVLIVDNVQSGGSMKAAGFRPLPGGIYSSAKLYATNGLKDDPNKAPYAVRLIRLVDSVAFARTHGNVKMNVRGDKLKRLISFMRSEHLYMQEPTITPPHNGGQWYQIDTVMPVTPPEGWEYTQDRLCSHGAETIVLQRPKQITGVSGRDYEKLLREGLTE